jgi:predicted GNAT family acetyltransferase
MRLTTYPEAGEFLAQTQAVLEQQETVNSLILGVCLRMRDLPDYVEAPPYLAAVHAGEQLVAAAMMTPPHNLVVASGHADYASAFSVLAHDLTARYWLVPGVNGPAPLSLAFAELWQQLTGRPFALKMKLRTFELTAVDHPSYPPGKLRQATAADADLLVQWVSAFGSEALQEAEDETGVRTSVERALKHGNYFVWDTGTLVAFAGKGRPTAHGITIGPVYTPPGQRNKGYATALVAALSQHLLDQGWRFITLFTDQANPTSNSIYQKIGFRPVCDFAEYRFE